MRRLLVLWVATGGLCLDPLAQQGPPGPGTTPDGVTILERTPHSRTLQQVIEQRDESGQRISATNTWVELRTGFHYADGQGNWAEAVPRIDPHPSGAIAQYGQHKVLFAKELCQPSAIQITTPSGVRLATTPFALAYYNPQNNKSVLLAQLKSSQGKIIAPNQVLYEDCFDSVRADVAYVYTRAGLEQNVILKEALPPPSHWRDAGLADDSCRLEVWSEFFGGVTPEKTSVVTNRTTKSPSGGPMFESDMIDETLDFGLLRTTHGQAFLLHEATNRMMGLSVAKRFLELNQRSFLVESVNFDTAQPWLGTLPPAKGAHGAPESAPEEARLGRVPPPWRPAKAASAPMQIAQVPVEHGFALDWNLSGYQTNFVFRQDTTYYVTDNVVLYGTTVFEGSVIKFPPSSNYMDTTACLHLYAPYQCKTGPYRPVIFTARDDDVNGTKLADSTGVPAGHYGGEMYLWIYADPPNVSELTHARFAHAWLGLKLLGFAEHVLRDVQFIHCLYPVNCYGDWNGYCGRCTLQNVLIQDSCAALVAYPWATFRASHLTARQSLWLVASFWPPDTNTTIYLTNSLVSEVLTNWGPLVAYCSVTNASPSAFQSVGAGYSYLAANSSYRHTGATNIDPVLATALKQRTTFPPVELAGNISQSLTLAPQAQRGTEIPDKGYAYVPLDYVVSNPLVQNATISLTNGVAIGAYGGTGFNLQSGSTLISEGSPYALNHLALYTAVQEQPIWWGTSNIVKRLVAHSSPLTVEPEVRLRFTEMALSGDSTNQYFLGAQNSVSIGVLSASDCQFWGGHYYLRPTWAPGLTVAFTNNVFHRANVYFGQGAFGYPPLVTLKAYNNLFYGGTLGAENFCDTVNWFLYDNAFANVTLTTYGSSSNGFNAYVNTPQLNPPSANDVVLPAFTYGSGPLGDYYQVTTDLRDRGSRTADQAGLYHYTARQDQIIEGVSQVDIGFHYPATLPNVFDATAGFSNVQGLNGWYYQYASSLGAVVGNLPFDPSLNWWHLPSDYYCGVAGTAEHPGATFDSVRTFVAPYGGLVHILNQAMNYNPGGDGVQIRVLKNQQTLADWLYLPNTPTWYGSNLNTTVQNGDTLIFQDNRYGNNGFDTTYWAPVITYLDPPAQAPLWNTDNDGLSDYFEDRNGNGLVDSGETDFRNATDPGLRVRITRPRNGAVLP